jgi:hypothetical protein
LLWLGRLGTRARHGQFFAVEPAALDLPSECVHVADNMSVGIPATPAQQWNVVPLLGLAVSIQIDGVADYMSSNVGKPFAIEKGVGGTVVGSLSEERHGCCS